MASKIDTKPLRLKMTDSAKSEITALAARIIQKMNEAGYDADGKPFPDGVTKKITMHDSGRMHRDFEAYTTRLQYKAPYARHTYALYNWMGIPKDGPWRAMYEREVQAIIDRHLTGE